MNKEERNWAILIVLSIRWILVIFVLSSSIYGLRKEVKEMKEPTQKCARVSDIEIIYDELYNKIDSVDSRVLAFGTEIEGYIFNLEQRLSPKIFEQADEYDERMEKLAKCEKIFAELD